MLPAQKNLQFIQLLRGIACILVALMHVTVTFSQTYHLPFLGNIFKFGGAGVDIFFVLSGFIITYSNKQYITKATSIGKFFKKRMIRIFPIYWIIISLLLVFQLLLPSFYRTYFQLTAANIFNTYFLLPNHDMINGVSWSLTNEMFFYILFMLALLIPSKKFILLLLFVYLAFLIVLPAIPITTTNINNGFTQLLIFPMNIEFLLGVLVVFLLEKFPQKWCFLFLVTGVGCFIFSAAFYTEILQFLTGGYRRAIMFGFPSFLIILSLVKYELTANIKVHNLFLKIGDASYSIYLFHLPVVVAFFKIMVKLPVTNQLLLVLLNGGLLCAICFAGILIYKKIESPLIKWLTITLT